MPLLPTPVTESWIGGGDLPVDDAADVLKEFDPIHRRPEVAPVRDAFCEGYSEGFIKYQNVAAFAAAQSDPMRAVEDSLKSFAEEHSIVPTPGETEESIRARMFRAPKIVTPKALVDAVDAFYGSPGNCFLSELELDGWFVHGDTSVWDSFVGNSPDYPDRLYDSLTYMNPDAAIPSSGFPRAFILRIAEIVGPDADTIYQQIVGVVKMLKGQGISIAVEVGL